MRLIGADTLMRGIRREIELVYGETNDECAEHLDDEGAEEMTDFNVVLPTTTEEWQSDMNIAYNQALEDFERKMAYFCFGLRASEGNLCRVDVVEDELQRAKRQLMK